MVDQNLSDQFPLIRASKSKFKSQDLHEVDGFNQQSPIGTPLSSNNATQVCTTQRFLMDSGRGFSSQRKVLQKKRKPSQFRGNSIRQKLTELKAPVSLFRQCTHPTREFIKFKYENVGRVIEYNTVLSYLSLEKFKELSQQIPRLQQNKLSEIINMNSNLLRPYIIDYFIPLKWEFLDQSGKRNGLYKFRNAVLHTLRSIRNQRKTLNLFDRVHNILVSEELGQSRQELKLNLSRTDQRTSVTNLSAMSPFQKRRSIFRSNSMFHVNQLLRRAESIATEQNGRFNKLMKRLDFLEYLISEEHSPKRPDYRTYLTTKKLTTITDRLFTNSEVGTPSRATSINSQKQIEDFIQMYEEVMKHN